MTARELTADDTDDTDFSDGGKLLNRFKNNLRHPRNLRLITVGPGPVIKIR